MVQDKKKNMDDARKGRMGREEEEKTSTNKAPSKPTATPSKNESSSSKKSR